MASLDEIRDKVKKGEIVVDGESRGPKIRVFKKKRRKQYRRTKGHRSLRVVFSAWWEVNAGQIVPELLNDGQILHYSQLHRRTRPKRPEDSREDRRWTDDEELGWPISHEDFERWARERHWQFARTMPQNPHEYTHRAWGHEETFLRVVLHLREHGRQEVYGGDLYTYYVANGFKHWSMGADLMSTILINRKPVGQDESTEETSEAAPEDERPQNP
jgi:hypothetical protein